MAKIIAVFTGTRAEYGLLYWLMKDIQADPELTLKLIVSGTHFSPEFGLTYRQIELDGFDIDERIEMLLSSDTSVGVVKSMGLALIGLADALDRLQPDVLVILGDRYEALAAAQAAMLQRIPVAHLHGGEITEGAYDDAIRHAITKMSYLHFTAAEPYRQRVIQLGEDPERVLNVGAVGLDHIVKTQLYSLEELQASLGFELCSPFFVVTYHPVTLADEPAEESFKALLNALDQFPKHQVILTYPNADDGGRAIIPLLEQYAAAAPQRVFAIPSLGYKRYLSAVKFSAAVIGNSSSGIIEVPSLGVPTIDIGQRQQGRLAAESVLHCEANAESISMAIERALSPMNQRMFVNPYGAGDASSQIVDSLKMLNPHGIKHFHDIDRSMSS
ncbi:UDP-N-acetylglucosamine 2-epimerase [Pantoea agglomerans]|uniref:UDP-N-acetylglucosamine 2-epimerase (Hydrolyzing) n=1 Tax=Enterobacter agglomerans TaxID=549 RepID=A0ACC5RS11_ENTAG|nr:UDP-N-acetylglucosamine 2-epimerase [Pantoea agglomerans]MBK4727346.1 UDP-N-acetylglucosamine 2-epimerase (hydrolyzing) [Pantoea agglomerans]